MAIRPFSRHLHGQEIPAVCARSGHDTDLIDMGADDILGYGRIYMCMMCIAELAQQLDFVDGESARRTVAAEAAKAAAAQKELADSKSVTIAPEVRKIERLARDFAATADRLLDRFVPDPVNDAGPALPDGASAVTRISYPAVGVPVDSDGDRDSAGEAGAGSSGSADGGQPVEVRQDDRDADAGVGALADADAEVDGPDVDESFGWLEQGDGEGAGDPAVDPDDAGDEGPDRLQPSVLGSVTDV